jgi:hypothetical protein
MDRDFRNKPSGIVFTTVLILGILLSTEGLSFIKNTFSEKNDIPLLSVLGVIIVLLSSDAFGYIFVSLGYFILNLFGGYSLIFGKLILYKDFKNKIVEYFSNRTDDSNESGMVSKKELKKRLARISPEIMHVYFYWYKEGSQNPYDGWLIRRYTSFFTSISVFLSLIIGNLLVWCIIHSCTLTWTSINTTIAIISSFISFVLVFNGFKALKDAVQLHDLWISGKDNYQFHQTYEWINGKNGQPVRNIMVEEDALDNSSIDNG